MSSATQRVGITPLTVEMRETHADHWVASFLVNDAYSGVSAHFPKMPILAGYMQLGWVELLLKRIAPTLRIEKIIETKFSGRIVPPIEVIISLTLQRQEGTVSFTLADVEGVKSQGRLAVGGVL